MTPKRLREIASGPPVILVDGQPDKVSCLVGASELRAWADAWELDLDRLDRIERERKALRKALADLVQSLDTHGAEPWGGLSRYQALAKEALAKVCP